MKGRDRAGPAPDYGVSLLKHAHHKINNHHSGIKAKATIRQHVLDVIGAAQANVFEGFAGEGQLHRLVWHKAANYTGCDLEWYRDERLAYVCDSARVLRAIDLAQFNIFDFDPWGSPWTHVYILAERRSIAAGERIGLVLTEGSGLKVGFGTLPVGLGRLAGMRAHVAGGRKGFADIIDRAIAGTCKRLSCQVIHRWQAEQKGGAAVRYIGLVLEGLHTVK
jgi:hypothetical protein